MKSKIMLTSILLTTGCLSMLSKARAQEIHVFTVKDAIEYGAKNSSRVKNALLNYKIQEQTNRAITSEALPQLTGTFTFTDNLIIPTSLVPGEFAGQPAGTFIPIKFGTQYNTAAGLTLKQVLFDGQVFVGLQARQTALNFYRKSQEITEQDLRVNTYKVYYQLLLSRTQMDLIDANISRAKELLHSSTVLFQNGLGEKLDMDKAAVQLSNLETEKVETTFNIQVANLGLKILLGMPIKDSLVLKDSLTFERVRDVQLSDDQYQYADRKDFQLLRLTKDLNEFDIKRYRKLYIPTVSVNAYLSQNAFRTQFDVFKNAAWYPSSYFSLNINVPIFDGLYKDANIQKAKITLQQTENDMDALKIRIDGEVKQAELRYAAAMGILDSQKKNMDLAQSVYEQTRKKYEQGAGSNTEIITSESDLKQAQNNYLNALYNAILAKIEYQNSVGKI